MNIRFLSLLLASFFIGVAFQSNLQAADAVDAKTRRLFDIKIREASSAFDQENLTAASAKIAEADTLIPHDPTSINLRGAVLYKQKKYEEALVVFQELIDRDTNSYSGYFNKAEVELAQGKYDEALNGFARILEARPSDEVCMFRIVLILALQKNFEEARSRAKRIPHPGQTAAYYYANAAVEFVAGNTAKGRQWIQQSEMFFPAVDSESLHKVLVEHDLLPKVPVQ